jgi:membrane associated rhomboid family serine protease
VGIPLGDVTRRTMHRPVVTIFIIVVNVIVFLMELTGGDAFVQHWSLIPANIVAGHDYITILTSMFMHEGWLHIGGNMIFLWAFGPQIEDAMGPFRYLTFYLLCGLAASAGQVAASATSTIPNLGASGAIAGVMGAFIVTYPRDRIRTILFIFVFATVTVLPAGLLIGIWFLMQLFNQIGSVASAQTQNGGVAYMAHVAGFIFGALVGRLFEHRDRIGPPAPLY